LRSPFGFVVLPAGLLAALAAIVLAYLAATEAVRQLAERARRARPLRHAGPAPAKARRWPARRFG